MQDSSAWSLWDGFWRAQRPRLFSQGCPRIGLTGMSYSPQPVTTEQAILLAEEPRFWQQEYRRSALLVVSDGMLGGEFPGLGAQGCQHSKSSS